MYRKYIIRFEEIGVGLYYRFLFVLRFLGIEELIENNLIMFIFFVSLLFKIGSGWRSKVVFIFISRRVLISI